MKNQKINFIENSFARELVVTNNSSTIKSHTEPQSYLRSIVLLSNKMIQIVSLIIVQMQSLPLSLSQTSPSLQYKSFENTSGEKGKLLVTSNFFFSPLCFLHFGELSAIFIKFEIVVCKLFPFGRV